MRKLYSILALCAFLFLSVSSRAADYTVEPTTAVASNSIPYFRNSASVLGSVTQQIYLPSEFNPSGAAAGNITAITFYYGAKIGGSYTAPATTRSVEIYLMETDINSYELDHVGTVWKSKFLCNGSNKAGTKVYDGNLTTNEVTTAQGVQTVTITLNSPFAWDGSSNIVLTLYDKSTTTIGSDAYNYLKFYITATNHARFVHWLWLNGSTDDRSDWINNINRYGDTYGNPSVKDSTGYADKRNYVPKATFSITPSAGPTLPSTPEDLAASSIGSTSASLSWTAVEGATSYDLYNSTSIDGVYSKFASSATNSYDWLGLTASTTYFVKVAAVNEAGSSDLSEPFSFTTLAPHTHDGITFEPWSNPSALPTSGNYFLNTDVAFGWESGDVTLTGDLNLCLNGHEANLAFFKIIVPDGKTLAIFDNAGGGKITSFVASEVGAFDIYAKALIVVYNGAELDLHQGTIENTYVPDEDGQSYAIYSNGTLRLSGDVLINSNSADIYLYASNIITIDGAISNSEKHTIWKNGGAFTSGWSTYMSGENPRDFFESANPARSVCLNEGEASLRTALNLSESSDNDAIGDNYNQTVDVNLTRSLTPSQYNTFCLPFALDDAQLQELFGAGYDLEEFVSSSLEGDVLSLEFSKVTSLEAGKPYLLQPSVDVANPSFEGVTITKTEPEDQTSDTYISFKGTFAPTELEGSNKNLLFLGAGNELFWPDATGNLKGFRAYFEVKGSAAKAAKQARIVKNENHTQAIDNIESNGAAQKRIIDGQLVIEKNGMLFNAQGQMVK